MSTVLAAVFGLLALISCETTEPMGRGRRPPPTVLIPAGLGTYERELLPEVEDALTDAGFRVTYRTPADYALSFDVDDGPVNADVHLRLQQGGEEVAAAYARVGGPRIIVRRREVIRESFDKCLAEFSERIEGLARRRAAYDDGYGGSGSGGGYGSGSGYRDVDDDEDYRGSGGGGAGRYQEYRGGGPRPGQPGYEYYQDRGGSF